MKIFKKILGLFCVMAIVSNVVVYADEITEETKQEESVLEIGMETEEILLNEAEDGVELFATTEPQKLIYMSYAYTTKYETGQPVTGDIVGGITLPNNTMFGLVYDENAGKWIGESDGDSGFNWVEKDGKIAAFTTSYTDSRNQYKVGSLYYSTRSSSIATNEQRNFVIDVEYFGNTSAELKLIYTNGLNSGNNSEKSIARINNNQWNIAHFELTDFCMKPNSTNLCGGRGNIKLDSRGVDTYISKIVITNAPDYETDYPILTDAEANLDIGYADGEYVENDFLLPTVEGCEIEWTSDNPAVEFNDKKALITRDVEAQSAKITAKIIKGGVYVEKSFDIMIPAKVVLVPVFSEPVVDINAGSVSVDITDYDGDITLFVFAKNKQTGKLTAVNTATATGDGTISAKVSVGANEELGYVVLNNNGASLKNYKPTKPAEFKVITAGGDEGAEHSLLRWNPSADDNKKVVSYVVSDGDTILETIDATTSAGNFDGYSYQYKVETPIVLNQKYNYNIYATDHAGLKSDIAEASVKIAKAYMNMAVTDVAESRADVTSGGLTFLVRDDSENSDAYTEFSPDYNGEACRHNVVAGKSRYLYFSVDSDIVSESDNHVKIRVRYFANGGSIKLTYSSTGGLTDVSADKANTNRWEELEITLNNAYFTKPTSLTRSDFRLQGSGLYVSQVSVIK